MTESTKQRIRELLQEMTGNGFAAGVNVLIMDKGEENYFECGMIDLEGHREIRRDSIFRLYSMTKPVTACAVMMLLEDGVIELMDPVSKFIPGFRNQTVGEERVPVKKEMCIKDLLSMTSGLTYGGTESFTERETDRLFKDVIDSMDGKDAVTTSCFADRLGRIPLKFEPSASWQYGTSADVLGAVVEVAAGMSFRDFLMERLFEPIGMNDTDFYVPREKQERLAKVYTAAGGHLEPYTYSHLAVSNTMTHIPAFQSGGAGLVSTVDDYARFAGMLMQHGSFNGRRYLHPGTVRLMTGGCLMPCQQQAMNLWNGLEGYTYGNLMRVRIKDGQCMMNGMEGEYGWDGWLGAFFANDPVNDLVILLMMQKVDAGTTEYTRKIRNLIYREIE